MYYIKDNQSANDQKEYQTYKNVYYDMNNMIVDNNDIMKKQKKHKAILSDVFNQLNKNFINVDHIYELSQLECWVCHISFSFNNKLHKHLHIECHYDKIMTKTTLNNNKIITKTTSNKKTLQQALMLLNQFSLNNYIRSTVMN